MIDAFIKRWESSGASERANYRLFLTEPCAVLEVEPPQPAGADEALNRPSSASSSRWRPWDMWGKTMILTCLIARMRGVSRQHRVSVRNVMFAVAKAAVSM